MLRDMTQQRALCVLQLQGLEQSAAADASLSDRLRTSDSRHLLFCCPAAMVTQACGPGPLA